MVKQLGSQADGPFWENTHGRNFPRMLVVLHVRVRKEVQTPITNELITGHMDSNKRAETLR